MIYRGLRIENEPKAGGPAFVIYETHRGHWRRVTSTSAYSQAEAIVDRMLAERERLFGKPAEPSGAR